MIVTLWAVIEWYKQLKDRSFKITLETWELAGTDLLGLHELYNKPIHITFGENPVKYEDIEDKLPEALEKQPKQKSASQRLRYVLYVLRKQTGKEGKFDDYYEKMMDKIIEFYKDKLD